MKAWLLSFGSKKNKVVQQQQQQLTSLQQQEQQLQKQLQKQSHDSRQQNERLQAQLRQLQEQHRKQSEELQQHIGQIQTLQTNNDILTERDRLAEQKLAETQASARQQIAMLHEQAVSQAGRGRPIFSYLSDSETTAEDFPLSGVVTALRQKLKTAILDLFKVIQQLTTTALPLLLESQASPWPTVLLTGQRESRNSRKERLLRDAFAHVTYLQLESLCWSKDADVTEAFCFLQKEQITSSIQAEQGAGTLIPGNATVQNRIAGMLDLYTKNCQYWLSNSRREQLLGPLAASIAQRLFKAFWADVNPEALPLEISAGFCAVVQSAICVRLHVESCHPCLCLSVADHVRPGELCVRPAVVVDSRMSLSDSGSNVRIAAEVEPICDD